MESNTPAKLISIGGIFSAFAILLHSSPVFLPGIGIILSPFASLPIALSAAVSPYLGIITLLTSASILLLISPQEAVIFLLTTGPLGLVLGLNYRKGKMISLAVTGGILFIGINILTSIVGIEAFGDITPHYSLMITESIFILFSFIYSYIWIIAFRFFINFL